MKSGKAMGSTTTTMALARKVSPLDPFPFDVMTELGSEGNEWACRPGACGRGVTSSPSEMFVRYCVSRYPRGLDAVLDGLVRLGVIMPRDPEGYVARVAKEMNEPVPDAFQVGTPHRPGSEKFLRDKGVWRLWCPDDTVRDAYRIFRSRDLRDLVTALLTAKFNASQIVLLLRSSERAVPSEEGIEEFRWTFWSVVGAEGREKDAWHADPRCPDLARKAYALLGEERNARVRVLTFLGLDHHVLGDEFVPDEQFREAYLRVAEANEEPDIIARIYRREAAVPDMSRTASPQ